MTTVVTTTGATMMTTKTGATDDDSKECSVCVTARLCWCHRRGAELGWSPSRSGGNCNLTIDERRDLEYFDNLDG